MIKLFPLPLGTEILASLFQKLAKKGIVVDIIAQSYIQEQQRVAFSIPTEDKITACQLLQSFLEDSQITVLENVSKISIVGVGMRNHPGVAAKFFKILSDVPIHLVTTSEIKMSAVIDRIHLQKVAKALHSAFQLDQSTESTAQTRAIRHNNLSYMREDALL